MLTIYKKQGPKEAEGMKSKMDEKQKGWGAEGMRSRRVKKQKEEISIMYIILLSLYKLSIIHFTKMFYPR